MSDDKEMYAGKVGRPPAPMSVVPGGVGTPIPYKPRTVKNGDRWHKLWTVGRAWLSNEAHYDQMRLLCEAMEDRDRIRAKMKTEAIMVTGSGGQRQTHPGFRQLDASEQKIMHMMEVLGFNPPKQKVKAQPAKEKSKLDQLRERQAAARDG